MKCQTQALPPVAQHQAQCLSIYQEGLACHWTSGSHAPAWLSSLEVDREEDGGLHPGSVCTTHGPLHLFMSHFPL